MSRSLPGPLSKSPALAGLLSIGWYDRRSLDAGLLAAVPNADAVLALYERHVDAVFRFAVRRCRSPEDVADLVSAVFSEVLTAAPSYDRGKGGVRMWLLGIAAHCLADQRRGEYRRAELAARLGAERHLD